MSRKQDRYPSRPRSLTSQYGFSPSMLGSVLGAQYGSYNNNYSSYSPSSYRNYNPYSTGFGRASSNLGIYGGTSSGYGGVYLSGASLGSLNLMTPVLKKLDKKLLASKTNFKPKPVPPAKVQEAPAEVAEAPVVEVGPPPVRPERKARAHRAGNLSKERSRSLTSLDSAAALGSRSLSLNVSVRWILCICGICPPNQEYDDCGSACPTTCSDPNPVCILMCVPGCFCIKPLVLNSRGNCVSRECCLIEK